MGRWPNHLLTSFCVLQRFLPGQEHYRRLGYTALATYTRKLTDVPLGMAYRISDVEGGVEVIIVAAGQVALCIETRQLGTSTDNYMETQLQHIEQGHCRSTVSECYM